jgi:hypothetical protein
MKSLQQHPNIIFPIAPLKYVNEDTTKGIKETCAMGV